jgi:hypothetical protein
MRAQGRCRASHGQQKHCIGDTASRGFCACSACWHTKGGRKEEAEGVTSGAALPLPLTTNREMAATTVRSAVAWARVTYSRAGAIRVLASASVTTACCRVPGTGDQQQQQQKKQVAWSGVCDA